MERRDLRLPCSFAAMTSSLIDAALEKLLGKYVFPDKALVAAELIRSNDYSGLSEEELCDRLTADLFAVCADKHLRVRIRARELQEGGQTEEAAEAAWREYLRITNYRIARVERLDGNVGLLDLRGVPDPANGAKAMAAAMELVSNTDALILDLRKNRGGAPDGVIFLCSYFFKDEEVLLNNIYDGATKQTKQYWALAWVPGTRYLDKPVYVLTSGFTFSAGEELCYNLQAQQRAVLIGQTTRGGAHPTDGFPLSDTVEITVPIARSINPITGTNWEGVGVKPDVELPEEQAFPHAYRLALEHIIANAKSAAVVDEARTVLAEQPAQ